MLSNFKGFFIKYQCLFIFSFIIFGQSNVMVTKCFFDIINRLTKENFINLLSFVELT